ncbi:MAG: HAD family phosphatase [Chloroflexi bacterium]|nr:MAG: HAD family phosphatase [Chloroflexota bacterium]
MIRAMIFDLDGTLVKTEQLKAISYARAAVALCPHTITEAAVIEAFKDVVGLSRREVAIALVERFDLEGKAQQYMDEFGVSTTWQAYVQVRLKIYEEMLADPDVIRNNQWPHNMQLLAMAREVGCTTALATMSHCPQVQRVLEILELTNAFDFVATRDDVEHGKPDPEIYLLVSRELDVPPDECLVIEDSPSGVKAALNAGMHVVAVSTPFTRDGLHHLDDLDKQFLVDDPQTLPQVVADMFKAI